MALRTRLMPEYLTIDEWGGHRNGAGLMRLPVSELWVHHSVTNEDLGVPGSADAIADFRELDAIGLSRGHGGISYSYAIHPEGVVGEGQGIHVGAHTAGGPGPVCDRNPISFGVCFIGNFDDDSLTPAAIDAFHWLRDKLIDDDSLLPGVYPTGGHFQAPCQATGCPGAHIKESLDILRGSSAPPTTEVTPLMLVLLNNTGFHLKAADGQILRYWGYSNPMPADFTKLTDAGVQTVDVSDVELAQAYLIDQNAGLVGTGGSSVMLDVDRLAAKIGGEVGAELGRRLAS